MPAKKKELVMVAIVTLVAIGVVLSITALVSGAFQAVAMVFGG